MDAEFLNYAKAEKELCGEAGAALTRIISEIQARYGISIAELRVTMDWSHAANGWPAANCVMVREYEPHAAPATGSQSVGHAFTAPVESVRPGKQESRSDAASDR